MTAAASAAVAEHYDIVIVGGGVVGLTLAHLLVSDQADTVMPSVAVLEPRPPEPGELTAPEIDLRVAALAPAVQRLYTELDVWQQLPPTKVCAYERMRVWQGGDGATGSRSIGFDAAELGLPALGHIVETRALRAVLWNALAESGRCTLLTDAAAEAIRAGADSVAIETAAQPLEADLLVGADGAQSWVREQLDVAQAQRSYAQHAIVAHIATERGHAATAWQKFLPDGPVALLPLADGTSSLVWSVSTANKEHYLELDNAAFAAELEQAFGGEFGALRCVSPRAAFPLASAHAARYTGRRFALLGDAAHRVHPLAGQGLNLGIYDAQALAAELAVHLRRRAADAGDPLALRRYERSRKGDNLLTLRAMDALNGLFRSRLAELGGTGMHLLDERRRIKGLLARYAMGLN